MKRAFLAMTVAAMLSAGGITGAHAAKHSDPPCTINPGSVAVGQSYTVTASGLPTMTPLNLFITDSAGTTAVPLGSSATGTYSFSESSPVAGTTTYQITGAVKNAMTVYSTCSVSVT